jgi:hypothetical protein
MHDISEWGLTNEFYIDPLNNDFCIDSRVIRSGNDG